MTLPVEQKTMKKNANPMLNSFLYMRNDLEQDNGHFSVLVLRRSGTISVKTVHKECGTILLERMLVEFAESGHPIFRAATPLSRGQLKS